MTTAHDGKSRSGAQGGAGRLVLLLAVGLVAAILGLALSLALFGGGDQRRGGPFSLIDHTGAPADESLLKGKLSLVYFGFTHCPDVCPTDLLNAVEAQDKIAENGGAAQVVFISVDPDRDDVESVASYVGAFSDEAIGLTGTPEQVAQAAKAYDVVYAKSPLADPNDPDSYEIIHSTYLYAVGPDGREIWRFPSKTPPDVISSRLRQIGASN